MSNSKGFGRFGKAGLTKKETVFRLSLMVREAGLEPARPEWTLEPESSESANSTTRACASLIITSHPRRVKWIFYCKRRNID